MIFERNDVIFSSLSKYIKPQRDIRGQGYMYVLFSSSYDQARLRNEHSISVSTEILQI